jgi:uracil phosphoribosyltransferase
MAHQTTNQTVVLDHPLIQHKLTQMRDETTSTGTFRRLLKEVGVLMAYEVTRDLSVIEREVKTPFMTITSPVIQEDKVTFVSILRAGNGLLNGMLEIFPEAKVGHVGLYRDPSTLVAIEYYLKLPSNMEDQDVIILDPMLATANSAIAAVNRVKDFNPRSIKFVNLLCSKKGLETFCEEHPDVKVFTASIDETLDDRGYILPGLGDAGDRIYGTK